MTDGIVSPFPTPERLKAAPVVSFNRQEFNHIMAIYGRMVAAGEWRDYALDIRRDAAVFSVFRRASEMPVYRIVKAPELARRQGAYTIYGLGGQILKRGHDLAQALKIFERKLLKVIEDCS